MQYLLERDGDAVYGGRFTDTVGYRRIILVTAG